MPDTQKISYKPEGFQSVVPYLHVNGAAMPCGIHIFVPDTDATYKRALEAGATSLHEPADQFYGERSAGVRDFAGNNWYIATVIEKVSKEEMDRRVAAMASTH